ncbi:MAG TPA: beta-galactosidase [Verrucomicrobiae bacterium]|nr:beta-galactosidase [Verrucomicrobiae bacterium]
MLKFRSTIFFYLAIGIAWCDPALGGTTPARGQNLVVDGGFENGGAGWQFLVSGAQATGGIDASEHHGGSHSYKLTNQSGFAPNVYARVTQRVAGLRPYTTYKVSCWAKGSGCGIDWIGGGPGWFNRNYFPKGDFDWTNVSFEVTTGESSDPYELMVLTESATRELWVDDIHFEQVAMDGARQAAVFEEISNRVAAAEARLDKTEAMAQAQGTAESPYVRLGFAVARRFIGFAGKGTTGENSPAWARLQLDEIGTVLSDTERLLRQEPAFLKWRRPRAATVRFHDGTFSTHGHRDYFAGYGHFDSVIQDLPNFPALGVSLIQDGRAGPSSMNADGSLVQGAERVIEGLDKAARFGVREDFLLSPHYFPAWANAADLHNGNIGFLSYNIFHPEARAVLEKWIAAMAARIKDKPALHSVCLANEPVYISSGRDKYTRPLFAEYLQKTHGSIHALNELYGTAYQSFEGVPPPPIGMPGPLGARRAYYDWTMFNKQMFADWHAWLASRVKEDGIQAPTHTKIMVFQSLDRDKLCYGVDPELMCRATDLAGCDAYAFMTGANTYDWAGEEFFYDLLNSFRGQDVFNSENHLIPDGSPPSHIPMAHTRCALWQGGLHHQISTTIWVWEKAADPSLAGSIYFRPANVYGAGKSMLDLARLGGEATAINEARPRVALLYSQPAIFWDEAYAPTLRSLYAALTFSGEPVTFVSERQLAEGSFQKPEWLIIPNAAHVLSTTPLALERFNRRGGRVLAVGAESLKHDEYDRSLRLPANLRFTAAALGTNGQSNARMLRDSLSDLKWRELRDNATGQPAWGVEYRVARAGRSSLIPLVNLSGQTITASAPEFGHSRASDELSGEDVAMDHIVLDPMQPRLLKIPARLALFRR